MVYLQNKVLTVSVAAFNVEKYIEECLLPFTQDGVSERCEVLVIDDGGTDNTRKVAERFERDYPNTFSIVHKENGGWGSTVNTAIQLASGKYFKQLDGDDYFLSSSLNDFLDELERTESDIVFSPFITFISSTKEKIETRKPAEHYCAEMHKEYPIGSLKAASNIAMHQCTFKTSILKNNNISLLEHAFYTDVEFVEKALCYSSKVTFVPMTVYCYRTERAGQSMSVEGIRKHYREHERVLFRIADHLRENIVSPGYAHAVQCLNAMIIHHYYFCSKLSPTREHLQEIKAFDSKLKNEYPEFYEQNGKRVKLLRKTHFLLYLPMCRLEV